MQAPLSRSRMDKLGKRLAAEGHLHSDERAQFLEVLQYYQWLLDSVSQRVSRLGFRSTSRVKTTGTLTEKLKRERGIQLTRINDVAGLRVVVAGSRHVQNATCSTIVDEFAKGDGRKPLVIDRRTDPRQGYRAVHLVVFVDGFPVEIQVRTQLQDSWAQIFERVADGWGRQIRYGGEVDNPSAPVSITGSVLNETMTRAGVVDLLQALSRSINGYEVVQEAADAVAEEYQILQLGAGATQSLLSQNLRQDEAFAEKFFKGGENYTARRAGLVRICESIIKDRRRRNRIVRRSFPSSYSDVTLLSWSRGLDTLTSLTHAVLVQSREQRDRSRRILIEILSDLANLHEEEAES